MNDPTPHDAPSPPVAPCPPAADGEATRDRFLPVRLAPLLAWLAAQSDLCDGDPAGFRRMAHLLESLFHEGFLELRQQLKDSYSWFDPESAEHRHVLELAARELRAGDAPVELEAVQALAQESFGIEMDEHGEFVSELGAPFPPRTPAERNSAAAELLRGLDKLLGSANYERLPAERVHASLAVAPIYGIGLKVDLGEFAEFAVWRRGNTQSLETVPRWFGLRQHVVRVPAYGRVCVFVRFQDQAWFDERKQTPETFEPGSIAVKLFRDVPRDCLEMLFPNATATMRPVDRWVIGVPTAVYGGYLAVSKLLLAVGALSALSAVTAFLAYQIGLRDAPPEEATRKTAVATLVGLGVLGGFLLRQWNKFKSKKVYFLKVLSEKLYFRNLDNGPGVFHHLLDAAEEAEIKEALLAWSFLRRAGGARTVAELDADVEAWLGQRIGRSVDFDEADGLAKLIRLDLVEEVGGGRYVARPLPEALAALEAHWDELLRRA